MTKEAIFLSKRESLQNKETINPQLIHGNFFKNAEEKPDNVCVYFSDGTEYSYGYIAKKARQLAKKINDICFDENEKIKSITYSDSNVFVLQCRFRIGTDYDA